MEHSAYRVEVSLRGTAEAVSLSGDLGWTKVWCAPAATVVGGLRVPSGQRMVTTAGSLSSAGQAKCKRESL